MSNVFFAAAILIVATSAPPQAASQASASSQTPTTLDAAKVLVDQGKLTEAESRLREYLQGTPGSADAHFLLGYVLFREIQAGVAADRGSQGFQYNELSAPLSFFAKSHAEESLAEYTAGARYRQPSAFDLKIVAFNYVLLNDYASADKWLMRALEWSPQDSEGWYYLGRAKYNENYFADAIRAFEKCLELSPEDVKAEDNIGLSYEALGRTTEATEAYQKAIAWQSKKPNQAKDAGPFLNLGSLLLDQNRTNDALNYLARAVEIAPKESRTHEKLGKAYSLLDRLPEAQRELELAVALAPQDPRTHFLLGQVYRRAGLVEKAKTELARSAELNNHATTP